MTCYVVMSNRPDLPAIAAAAARGERPRHAMGQLAELTGAVVVQPGGDPVRPADRLLARVVGLPEHWALARALRRRLRPGDTVYCTDEAVGFPVAARCGGPAAPARILVCVHNLAGPRKRAAFPLFGLARRAAFMAVAKPQIGHLLARGVPQARAHLFHDQTDLGFFSPGAAAPAPRPVVMSIGLERRDYRTLAAATADLPVDVAISGFSTDARAIARAFPPAMPANMTRGYHDWPDLLALYRRAGVAAVSLVANDYAAGIQALLEAIACATPVVVTATAGLAGYLDRADLVTAVPPGDPAALRAAIRAKLDDPAAAARQARAARDHYLPAMDSDAYVRGIAALLAARTD